MKNSGIGGSATIGGSLRDDRVLSSVFRIKPRVQRLPIDHEFAARGFVLLRPVHQQVQASVVDVVQVLKIDVQFGSIRNLLQLARQPRKPNERGGSLQ